MGRARRGAALLGRSPPPRPLTAGRCGCIPGPPSRRRRGVLALAAGGWCRSLSPAGLIWRRRTLTIPRGTPAFYDYTASRVNRRRRLGDHASGKQRLSLKRRRSSRVPPRATLAGTRHSCWRAVGVIPYSCRVIAIRRVCARGGARRSGPAPRRALSADSAVQLLAAGALPTGTPAGYGACVAAALPVRRRARAGAAGASAAAPFYGPCCCAGAAPIAPDALAPVGAWPRGAAARDHHSHRSRRATMSVITSVDHVLSARRARRGRRTAPGAGRPPGEILGARRAFAVMSVNFAW